ncbi:PTS sugar transporter subunit IIA [Vibrio porteresiae]|uniref:PTS sugar transporter subunit IIA n=1 Tax=Vibrio porteresiae DSM 19223 TaxID=1123496 RepID=A0ABZ0QIN0_9VIBR|nr:PTS sugar transporter subunit IIA [Vibrio porteresiae]WPC76067.1 PTS sugar transporter subunit IIA [Vibrio porteresiae DSM 19223]
MLNHWLSPNNIHIVSRVHNWEEAVKISCEPLIKQNVINDSYVDAIIEGHKELGPYYVLAPGLAMPHARPEKGANKCGLSLLIVKEGVPFQADENDPVHAVITLAAKDDTHHIEMIQALAEMFSNDQDREAFVHAQNKQQLEEILARY